MSDHPFDQYDVQLPGRLLALEVLTTILLRKLEGGEKIAPEAAAVLTDIRNQVLAMTPPEHREKARTTFDVADESLAKIAKETKPR